MRILADLHIAPRTVDRSLDHDVVRVSELGGPTADMSDRGIVEHALASDRVISTQDLDFSALVALSGRTRPSVITLRLSSARIEDVNSTLTVTLPRLEADLEAGAIVSVEDTRVRVRRLPVD